LHAIPTDVRSQIMENLFTVRSEGLDWVVHFWFVTRDCVMCAVGCVKSKTITAPQMIERAANCFDSLLEAISGHVISAPSQSIDAESK
jgi:hypothetical protein